MSSGLSGPDNFGASVGVSGDEPSTAPTAPDLRKVLVGRSYSSMKTNWAEWDSSFEDVCGTISKRREDGKVNDAPDEIIEVIVVRRAVVRGEIHVEEVKA